MEETTAAAHHVENRPHNLNKLEWNNLNNVKNVQPLNNKTVHRVATICY